jgi:hypothetical protein
VERGARSGARERRDGRENDDELPHDVASLAKKLRGSEPIFIITCIGYFGNIFIALIFWVFE